MSSFFSTLPDSDLKTLLKSLDIPEELHIVSIKYTVRRESLLGLSYSVEILCLPEEKKK